MPLPAAEVAPLTPEFQVGLFSLLGLLVIVLGILAYFKRKPSLDEELVKFQVTIDVLQQNVAKLTVAVDKQSGHDTELSNLREKVKRLEEQRESDAATQRRYIGHISTEISGSLDKLKDSLATNLKLVERALGRVEGEVSGLSTRVANLENKS